MKVQDVMCTEAASCRRSTNLAEAARIMWNHDCGAVPVVDEAHRVVGMITDRDICMATATRNRHPAEIAVGDVISGSVYAVPRDADVRDALETMKEQQVRRLPVIGDNGTLAGVLSLADVIQGVSVPRRRTSTVALSAGEVLETLKAIGQRQTAGVAE